MKQGTSPRFDNSWRALARPDTAEGYFHLSAVPAFEPESRAYRPANAWWLAELSRLIYRRDSRDTILARVGLCERRFFDRDSTQGALLETVPGRHAAPFAVLVFRGTLDIRDWLANLHILPWRWPGGGFVHGGFAEALDAVWDEIAAALEQVRVPLFYTGHSLGAALATLAAARMPPHAVYTFGSPRVGDAGFARHLADVPVYRLVNHCDLVPTVPPPGPLKFRHVGKLYYITHDNRLLRNVPEAVMLRDWLRNDPSLAATTDYRRWYDPVECLADHAPVNYVAHLARFFTIGQNAQFCYNF